MKQLLEVRPEDWETELDGHKDFFSQFGDRLPEELWNQHRALKARLKSAVAA